MSPPQSRQAAALDLDELLARARQVALEVVAPMAERTDREARWPQEGIRALLAAGLGGLVVPVEAGGHGHGLLALVRVCEELGRHCPSTALCYGMHCVGAAVIAGKATPDQRERYLEPIARGEHLTTLALSEPGTGAHFYFPQTTATALGGDAYEVTGQKSFVTNGSHADSYVISTVAAEADAPPGQFSCLVLPADIPGLEWGAPWSGFGMRGNDSRGLRLERARIDRHDLLGSEGDEIWYLFNVIAPYFLMAMSGSYFGIAVSALTFTHDHVAKRGYPQGATLGQQPVIQHRLGEMWAMVERTRSLVYAAAAAADTGDPDALPGVLSSKAEVADCAVAVTNEAMTLCGGRAYREGSLLQRALRDARASHVMAPTTDILRTWTGRSLLGLPLLGD